jgi:FkbM family methyltransferase
MHVFLRRFVNFSSSMFGKARVRYRRIVRPQVVRHRGIWVPIGEPLSETARQSLYSGRYELLESDMLREKLDPSDRVVEFGSGLGVTATVCAKTCGSGSTYAYEPNPELIPLIKKVFDMNNVSPTLHNAAVAKEPGEVDLFVNEDFFSTSIYRRENTKSKVRCQTVGFANVLKDIQPTFVLMDIEGAEYDLIGSEIHSSVRKFLFEKHEGALGPGKVEEVLNWITHEGFILMEERRYMAYFERLKKN